MNDTQQQHIAVVRAIYDAFGRGDFDAIAALVAPDVTVYQSDAVPWGGTYEGIEGLGRFLTALTTHLDSRPQTERLYADGAGSVVQVGRTSGTVRATGRPFDAAEVHLWTVADGKVLRFESYVDAQAILAALDESVMAGQPA